ncbi:Serine/threonine-protein kinase LMTK2 [Amphibalanus amphitrite]|uniref:Serine/threonine-protein kinase LMTK2 n=1 Tax=Amphibalanus amphitrite TaxID=1232801 RepID=A0A6A4VHS3_AMPAM|nr:Serine/threonine-protein kinase LMTK2 [Amphibalanus amphitrite]
MGPPAAIQGFNNATYDPTPAGELTLFPPVAVVSAAPTPGRPQFEPLPELTAAAAAAAAAAHPRPAIYNLSVSRGFSAKDWFDDPHRNFPRQQLKYQQELGTGWFGQVMYQQELGTGWLGQVMYQQELGTEWFGQVMYQQELGTGWFGQVMYQQELGTGWFGQVMYQQELGTGWFGQVMYQQELGTGWFGQVMYQQELGTGEFEQVMYQQELGTGWFGQVMYQQELGTGWFGQVMYQQELGTGWFGQVMYQQELGTGWFGQALLGEARNLTAEPRTAVVVKALRAGATLPEQMYFLHEMAYLRDANHPNVLRLLGRCLEADPYLLILERCGAGDAKEFLQRRSPAERQQLLETMALNKMAMDAAAGLQHLHDIHYTHSDLAARSCRVMSNCTLKIGDYGCNIDRYKQQRLSQTPRRPVYGSSGGQLNKQCSSVGWPVEEDYYIAGDVALPVRWCAPEILECTPTTIETKEVTKASNVWSLGVLMWELLAFAALPYAPLSDDDVIQHVVMDRNVQLSRPKLSTGSPHTDRMYHVMQLCWLPPGQRPTVHRIHALLSQLTAPPRDDFEERWEALRPRGRADGGSDSESPEPASLDSELHDALRSLDRMLAAEEPAAPGAGGGPAAGDHPPPAEDPDGQSAGSGDGRLAREQSRSVQDFLTLTAPLDSLEYGSERADSDPEPAREPEPEPESSVSTRAQRPLVEGAARGPALSAPAASACLPERPAAGGGFPAGGGGGAGALGDGSGEPPPEEVGAGGGTAAAPRTPHAVPQLCLTEATPPRQPETGQQSLQSSQTEEPPATEPRAFRFVLNENSDGSSKLASDSETNCEGCLASDAGESADLGAELSAAATSEYFTAADSTLAAELSAVDGPAGDSVTDSCAAGDGDLSGRRGLRLTSTPRGRRSPSFNEYIGSAYQTAVETQPDASADTLMGSRHSAPAYAPLAGDDLSAGSEPGCHAALLADDGDDELDMASLRREAAGGGGDVPRPCAGAADKAPLAEPDSPARSPSLSSTFGHSTCDELAELPDEEEVRSLCSRAELAPSKLWGSAEEPAGSPLRPDRRPSADVITVIEAAPGRAGPAGGGIADGAAAGPADRTPAAAGAGKAVSADPDQSKPDTAAPVDVPALNSELSVDLLRASTGLSSAASGPSTLPSEQSALTSEELTLPSEPSNLPSEPSAVAWEQLTLPSEPSGLPSEQPASTADFSLSDLLALADSPMVSANETPTKETLDGAVGDGAPLLTLSEGPASESAPLPEGPISDPLSVPGGAERQDDTLSEPVPVPGCPERQDDTLSEPVPVPGGAERQDDTPSEPVPVPGGAERQDDTLSEPVPVPGVPEPQDDTLSEPVPVPGGPEPQDDTLSEPVPVPGGPEPQDDTLSEPVPVPGGAEPQDDTLSESVPVPGGAEPQDDTLSEPVPVPGGAEPQDDTLSEPVPVPGGPEPQDDTLSEPVPVPGGPEPQDDTLSEPVPVPGGAEPQDDTLSEPVPVPGGAEPQDDTLSEPVPVPGGAEPQDDTLSEPVPVPGGPEPQDDTLSEPVPVSGGAEPQNDTLSECVPVPGGAEPQDDTLTSLDGSGGFELTPGELEMSPAAWDAARPAGPGGADAVGTGDGAATDTAVTAPAAPVTSNTGDSSHKYALCADSGGAVDALADDSPQPVPAAAGPGSKYQLQSELGASADGELSEAEERPGLWTDGGPSAGEGEELWADGGPSAGEGEEPWAGRGPSAGEGEVEPWAGRGAPAGEGEELWAGRGAPAGEGEELWAGLRLATEHTQALVEAARRQSPQKNYRSMFLEGAAEPADGAEPASRHGRHGSGGFDPLVPSGESPGAAFDPLQLELELELEPGGLELELIPSDEEAAFAAIRAELRRALPDPAGAEQEQEEEEQREQEEEEVGMVCRPAVPGLETIREEAEDQDQDQEDAPLEEDHIPDSWREHEDTFVEVEIRPCDAGQERRAVARPDPAGVQPDPAGVQPDPASPTPDPAGVQSDTERPGGGCGPPATETAASRPPERTEPTPSPDRQWTEPTPTADRQWTEPTPSPDRQWTETTPTADRQWTEPTPSPDRQWTELTPAADRQAAGAAAPAHPAAAAPAVPEQQRVSADLPAGPEQLRASADLPAGPEQLRASADLPDTEQLRVSADLPATEQLRGSADLPGPADVLSSRGEPDGSQDSGPPAAGGLSGVSHVPEGAGSAEDTPDRTEAVAVSQRSVERLQNGLGVTGGATDSRPAGADRAVDGGRPAAGLGGDLVTGEPLSGDDAGVYGDGDGAVQPADGGPPPVGVAEDTSEEVGPRQNGNTEAHERDSSTEKDIIEDGSLSAPPQPGSKGGLNAEPTKPARIEFRLDEPVTVPRKLRAASAEGAILIPGVGDVYSSLTAEEPTAGDAATASLGGVESGTGTAAVSGSGGPEPEPAAATRRPVSAALVAELRALASSAESRPSAPVAEDRAETQSRPPAPVAEGRVESQVPRSARGGAALQLTDLEWPAAGGGAAPAGPPPEPLSDSEASDVLEVDTESLEARLVAGGRPRAHLAFVPRAEPAPPPPREEERRGTDPWAEGESPSAAAVGSTVGDESDYEGDYESLPVDVTGPGLGPGPAAGLTRSVASYDLAGGAAGAAGWEGAGAEQPADWQYPAPGEGAAVPDRDREADHGQPASLPPLAGYHVLSHGEIYHKAERRRSLPVTAGPPPPPPPPPPPAESAAESAALTAEELALDASIPTYDDVRRFGEPADSLSSDEDDEPSPAGRPWPLGDASACTLRGRGPELPGERDGGGGEMEWGDRRDKRKEGEHSDVTERSGDKRLVVDATDGEEVSRGAGAAAVTGAGAASEGEGGDGRGPGELGLDESGDVLERPHRPVPGVQCERDSERRLRPEPDTAVNSGLRLEPDTAVNSGPLPEPDAAPEIEYDEDGVVFERLERPGRPAPGARPPPAAGAVRSPEDPAAAAAAEQQDQEEEQEGAAGPQESRWSPEAAFLEDDSPWSAADALALRDRLRLINEEYGEAEGEEGRAERAERLRRLNDQWGVAQADDPAGGRYTPDWEPDDDEEDGLSSTSGEFVWQDGADRAAAEAGAGSDSDSDSGSDSESESGEEEFTPSVWQQDLEPGHGLLRSPERKSDLRKSVSFKRQKHHRIYEYPGAPATPELAAEEAAAAAAAAQRKTWSFVAPAAVTLDGPTDPLCVGQAAVTLDGPTDPLCVGQAAVTLDCPTDPLCVGQAAVTHYTDWELDGEEIEDVSLTELPESPERCAPRLPAAGAAAHYFLSAEGDDGDEFYLEPALSAAGYTGGSSFSPAQLFQGAEHDWGAAAEHGWAAAPEGRFVDVWARGGAGRAEEAVSPDVAERPLVAGPDGGGGVSELDSGAAVSEVGPDRDTAVSELFLDLTGAPADTVDSGYTGSCDDRTLAAFAALAARPE